MPQGPTDALAWLTVAAFLAAALLERRDRRLGNGLGVLAWILFAAFWALLVPHFAFVQKSIIEGLLSALAVPGCLYVAYRLWRGHESLVVLTRAVAVMGLLYLPFTTIPWLARPLIAATASQVDALFGLLGYNPTLTTGDEGVASTFVFHTGGHVYRTSIVLACTGLGSITIFVGLVAAVRAPLRRKLRALAIVVPIIWVLNLFRNVFIALAQGKQWFADLYPNLVLALFGASDPHIVSFLWADRIIAQSLAVVALVGLTWLVVRELPELATLFEDLLTLATGREVDLGLAGAPQVRPDGRGER